MATSILRWIWPLLACASGASVDRIMRSEQQADASLKPDLDTSIAEGGKGSLEVPARHVTYTVVSSGQGPYGYGQSPYGYGSGGGAAGYGASPGAARGPVQSAGYGNRPRPASTTPRAKSYTGGPVGFSPTGSQGSNPNDYGTHCNVPMWKVDDFACSEADGAPDEAIWTDAQGDKRVKADEGAQCTLRCPAYKRWYLVPDVPTMKCLAGAWSTVDSLKKVTPVSGVICTTARWCYVVPVVFVILLVGGLVLSHRRKAAASPPAGHDEAAHGEEHAQPAAEQPAPQGGEETGRPPRP